MRRIGLTGGIGSGKSTVADFFARLQVPVVDTDVIAHELTGPQGAAMLAIRQAFGDEVIAADGRLDRAAMRRRVFADPAERHRLESILHPLIRSESDNRLEAAAQTGAPYALLVVPLLVESGSYKERVDRVLVVDCPEALQIARVMARNGMSQEEVSRILAAQASRQARLAVADDVIENVGGPENLEMQVSQLNRYYSAMDGGN